MFVQARCCVVWGQSFSGSYLLFYSFFLFIFLCLIFCCPCIALSFPLGRKSHKTRRGEIIQTFLRSAGIWDLFSLSAHSHSIKKINRYALKRETEESEKERKKNKSERRPVVGGCGGRVPLIKLNFHLPQRQTQIPASQSANLRQMIL